MVPAEPEPIGRLGSRRSTVDRRRRLLRAAAPFALVALIIVAILQLSGGLDWPEVWAALGRLQWWELAACWLGCCCASG